MHGGTSRSDRGGRQRRNVRDLPGKPQRQFECLRGAAAKMSAAQLSQAVHPSMAVTSSRTGLSHLQAALYMTATITPSAWRRKRKLQLKRRLLVTVFHSRLHCHLLFIHFAYDYSNTPPDLSLFLTSTHQCSLMRLFRSIQPPRLHPPHRPLPDIAMSFLPPCWPSANPRTTT